MPGPGLLGERVRDGSGACGERHGGCNFRDFDCKG